MYLHPIIFLIFFLGGFDSSVDLENWLAMVQKKLKTPLIHSTTLQEHKKGSSS